MPVRQSFLPFHQPWIDDAGIKAVTDVLQSGWITRGPRTEEFERAFATYVGSRHAIGLSSCTAGLHLALVALGIGRGDEVITSPITFPATANVIVHQGARPVFADVDRVTLNLDPARVEAKITPRTRAIIPVHFAGHPCRMEALLDLAGRHRLHIVEDAAHAIESWAGEHKVGGIGDFTAFSFYATKNLTTAEGGMLTTNSDELAERARILSLHGISRDAWKRYAHDGPLHWETVAPGYKYNMYDVQAALGLSQLERLEEWWTIRAGYVRRYREELADLPEVELLGEDQGIRHAYHLCVVLLSQGIAGEIGINAAVRRNLNTQFIGKIHPLDIAEASRLLSELALDPNFLVSLAEGHFYFLGNMNPSPVPLLITFDITEKRKK